MKAALRRFVSQHGLLGLRLVWIVLVSLSAAIFVRHTLELSALRAAIALRETAAGERERARMQARIEMILESSAYTGCVVARLQSDLEYVCRPPAAICDELDACVVREELP